MKRFRPPAPKRQVLQEWWKAPDGTYCGLMQVDGLTLPTKTSECLPGLDEELLGYVKTTEGTVYHLGNPGPVVEVRVVGQKHNIDTRSAAFLIEVVQNGAVKRTWKLMSDFQELHRELKPNFDLPFGNGDDMLSSMLDTAADARTAAGFAFVLCACANDNTHTVMEEYHENRMQQYMNNILNEPRYRISPALSEFLSLDLSTSERMAVLVASFP